MNVATLTRPPNGVSPLTIDPNSEDARNIATRLIKKLQERSTVVEQTRFSLEQARISLDRTKETLQAQATRNLLTQPQTATTQTATTQAQAQATRNLLTQPQTATTQTATTQTATTQTATTQTTTTQTATTQAETTRQEQVTRNLLTQPETVKAQAKTTRQEQVAKDLLAQPQTAPIQPQINTTQAEITSQEKVVERMEAELAAAVEDHNFLFTEIQNKFANEQGVVQVNGNILEPLAPTIPFGDELPHKNGIKASQQAREAGFNFSNPSLNMGGERPEKALTEQIQAKADEQKFTPVVNIVMHDFRPDGTPGEGHMFLSNAAELVQGTSKTKGPQAQSVGSVGANTHGSESTALVNDDLGTRKFKDGHNPKSPDKSAGRGISLERSFTTAS